MSAHELDLSLAFDDENVEVHFEYENVMNLFSTMAALGTKEMIEAVYGKFEEAQSE